MPLVKGGRLSLPLLGGQRGVVLLDEASAKRSADLETEAVAFAADAPGQSWKAGKSTGQPFEQLGDVDTHGKVPSVVARACCERVVQRGQLVMCRGRCHGWHG